MSPTFEIIKGLVPDMNRDCSHINYQQLQDIL